MRRVWLVAVEAGVSASLRDGCGAEVCLEEVAEADAAARIRVAAGEIDAVVIGALASEPIRGAERAQAADPDLAVVLLSEAGVHDRVARAAARAPFLGPAVSCVSVEDGCLAARVEEAARQTGVRRDGRRAAGGSNDAAAGQVGLGSFLDAAPMAVLLLEPGGRILCANRGAQRMLLASERELVGAEVTSLFAPADEPLLARLLAAARERSGSPEREPEAGDIVMRVHDGETRAVEITAAGIGERRGRAGIIAIMQDVTERESARAIRQLNVELERRIAELDAANRELDAFSYSVSHDLRAPLRVIDGFSQVLETDYGAALESGAQHALARVRAGARRMSALIEDLLNLSRVSRAPLRREFVDLGELARGVAAELARREPARRVELEIAGGLDAMGDGRLMTIVLENLLANAWKFTSKRPDARIAVGREPREGESPFFVRDNGAGFDMKYATRLFSPFQRLHRADEFEGTGVGLATVNRIIARHGGRIWVQAAEGAGATFFFTLGAGA